MCPDSKQDVKNHEIYTEANIEYFAFLNCCNLTFSQIQIIIKFLKRFVKEGLNFSQIVYLKDCLTVNVEYCGFFLA